MKTTMTKNTHNKIEATVNGMKIGRDIFATEWIEIRDRESWRERDEDDDDDNRYQEQMPLTKIE